MINWLKDCIFYVCKLSTFYTFKWDQMAIIKKRLDILNILLYKYVDISLESTVPQVQR